MPQIPTRRNQMGPPGMPPGFMLGVPETVSRERLDPPRSGDPDIARIQDQIRERQQRDELRMVASTPADLAFSLMRAVPRKDFNTPWTKLGHFPGGRLGVSVKDIRENKELRNLTPAQTILKLFELDDERIRKEIEFADPGRGVR